MTRERLCETILPSEYFKKIRSGNLEVVLWVPDGMPEYYQYLWVLKRAAES